MCGEPAGVLLLNACLTVRESEPNSHKGEVREPLYYLPGVSLVPLKYGGALYTVEPLNNGQVVGTRNFVVYREVVLSK